MRSFDITLVLASLFAASVAAQSPQPKMGQPLPGLSTTELQRFTQGRQQFTRVFSAADGLGPIFNQTSCASCHNNPIGGPGSITVTRFGFTDGKGNFDPLTALGGSLLQQAALAAPVAEIIPPIANTTATRVTPSALGMGLVEAIPDAAIAIRETNPPNPNISGRVHWVQPLETPTGPLRAGRFGWKAQIATTLSFSGDATQNELGFSNRLLPFDNAPNGNLVLLAAYDNVPDPEDGPDGQGLHVIDKMTNYQRYLAAPPQTPRTGMTGEAIFQAVGCADCHTPSFTTSNDPALEPAIRNKVIRPYSDFLVHDMGTAADFIQDGDVSGQELRTPSLWGMRNRDPLWHDGRVVGGTLQSRILGPTGIIFQHSAFGSEAAPSAAAFNALSAADKQKVVDFLDSLGRIEFDGNGDGVRNRLDLPLYFAARAGGPYTADSPQSIYDVNADGFVNQTDLQLIAPVWEENCNGNGATDLTDILNGTSGDANENLIPDECEACQQDLGFAGGGSLSMRICGDQLTAAGSRASFQLLSGPANGLVLIAIGAASAPYLITPTEFLVPLEPLVALVQGFTTDGQGRLLVPVYGGGNLPTSTWVFQAATFDGVAFDLSNALSVTVGGF
jgi:CxxC motif-containing protein (DUF1111 family)